MSAANMYKSLGFWEAWAVGRVVEEFDTLDWLLAFVLRMDGFPVTVVAAGFCDGVGLGAGGDSNTSIDDGSLIVTPR